MLSQEMVYIFKVKEGDALHALLHQELCKDETFMRNQREASRSLNVSLPTFNKHLRDLIDWELVKKTGSTHNAEYTAFDLTPKQENELIKFLGGF